MSDRLSERRHSSYSESTIASIVGDRLGLEFGSERRSLNSWGAADRCIELGDDLWLLLEIEGTQHHPNTNVLKLWPFLEENPQRSVILVHAFEKGRSNRVSSRGRLANWTANKMRSALGVRFRYHAIDVDPSTRRVAGEAELAADLSKICQKAARRIGRQRRR